jgi:hypothetical protein
MTSFNDTCRLRAARLETHDAHRILAFAQWLFHHGRRGPAAAVALPIASVHHFNGDE